MVPTVCCVVFLCGVHAVWVWAWRTASRADLHEYAPGPQVRQRRLEHGSAAHGVQHNVGSAAACEPAELREAVLL